MIFLPGHGKRNYRGILQAAAHRTRYCGPRNVIVHEYFGIDLEVVWNVIEHDPPELKDGVREILAQEA